MKQIPKLADHDHPLVQETAKKLIASKNMPIDNLEKIFFYVRDTIKFGYPANIDLVKASETIKLGIGQCNTKTALFLALCKNAGIPARIHFSLIKKEIQKGLFKSIFYKLLPPLISHSWIEVNANEKWTRIDSYINDEAFYQAGKIELKNMGWDTGYSIANSSGKANSAFNTNEECFVQMDAVVDDHDIWDEPADYYVTDKYRNRPNVIKLLLYRLIIKKVNKRVENLRTKYR